MTKDVRHMSSAEHLVSHGVVGAFSGLALGHNPLIQAAAQMMGEVSASVVKDAEGPDSKEQGIAVARVVGAMAGLTMGGDVKDINGAIEAGVRAAENNTYLGQEDMEKWEKKRQKKARQLVERGIVTQEEMAANYDSLSIADMAKIKAYHRQYVSKEVKGYGEEAIHWGLETYQDLKRAEQAFKEGDRSLEIRHKSALISSMQMAFHVFIPFGMATDGASNTEAPLQQMRVASTKGEWDVDPSSPFQWSELKRDAYKMYGHSGLDAQFDYARVLSGDVNNPEDYRNLAPFTSDLKKLKDRTGSLMHKWGASVRFQSQRVAMATGNERLAVDVGHAGEFVVDPMLAAGGLLKGAQLTKRAVQGVNSASRLIQANQGAGAVADVVSAAKSGSALMDRGASIASKTQGVMKPAAAASEKALAKDMSPRVKNVESGLGPRAARGVEASKADQTVQKTLADRTVRPVESRASLADELAQQPFDPFTMRRDFEAVYGAKNVKTATLPAETAPGVKYRGGRGPKSDVPYDMRGNPTFDYKPGNVLYQTMVEVSGFIGKGRIAHMKSGTQQLARDIESGIIPEYIFSEVQLKAIMGGKAKIPGYTWHHDQQLGRLILVKEVIHKKTPHTGAMGQMKNANK